MSATRGGWGRIARFYDALVAPLEALWLRRWRRRLWAAMPAAGLGLEVGAGTGANLAHHPPDARVVVTDLSWRMLGRARQKARARDAHGANVAFVVCDARSLPFRPGTFDWAVATLVFCEVPDPVGGLAELARTVTLGGPLGFLEHVRPHGPLGPVADALTALTGPTWGEHWNRDTAANAKAAGLAEVRAERLLGSAVVLLRAAAPGPAGAGGPRAA